MARPKSNAARSLQMFESSWLIDNWFFDPRPYVQSSPLHEHRIQESAGRRVGNIFGFDPRTGGHINDVLRLKREIGLFAGKDVVGVHDKMFGVLQ